MSDLKVPDLNRVIIAGRLARDVELKHAASGKAFAKCCVVNSRRYKSGDEWKEQSTFVDFTVWGQMAEYIAQLGKGRPVIVEGQLTQNEWTDKSTGELRKRLEINAERVSPLDWGKGPTAENRDAEAKPQPRMTQDAQETYQARQHAEDYIPF